MQKNNFKPFHGRQIFAWLHQRGTSDWSAMTDLPRELRTKLTALGDIQLPHVLECQRERDTAKLLLELADGERIETVVMLYQGQRQRQRITVCLSTQVGCPMGCRFCASGLSGLQRNLTQAELVGQVLAVQRQVNNWWPGARVGNLVLMGMGEPLLNYRNLLQALQIMHHPLGLNIGWRRITVSTCGLAPQIMQLSREGLPLVLAVSLHAPNNQLRDELMPVNRRYPLEQLIPACHTYANASGNRITMEYTLLAGINDDLQCARQLAQLLKGIPANVNLISFNPVTETPFQRPPVRQMRLFQLELELAGLPVVFREERGGLIDAACGQLRRRFG